MQNNILNIENWSNYKDEVGIHYTYKINNNYIYNMWINNINVICNDDMYSLVVCDITENNYDNIIELICLDKELDYCLNIAKENYKTYKNK